MNFCVWYFLGDLLLDPMAVLWMLTLAAFVFRLLSRLVMSRIFAITSIGWLFVIYISPVPQWLMLSLENSYAVADPERIATGEKIHIVILGGGHTVAPALPPTNQLEVTALGRLAEGIRIYRRLPGSKLVCSGSSASKRTSQAEMLALAACDLGVTPSDTLQISTPASTAEEAHDYIVRFGTRHRVVLVTSAFHMRRAVALFKKQGIQVIPAPTNHYLKNRFLHNKRFDFRPSLLKIQMMDKALHEYAGLLILHFF